MQLSWSKTRAKESRESSCLMLLSDSHKASRTRAKIAGWEWDWLSANIFSSCIKAQSALRAKDQVVVPRSRLNCHCQDPNSPPGPNRSATGRVLKSKGHLWRGLKA